MTGAELSIGHTSSCLIELLPFGPPRPCHLPFAIALSLTLRSFRVSLSQTKSMLAYLQLPSLDVHDRMFIEVGWWENFTECSLLCCGGPQ